MSLGQGVRSNTVYGRLIQTMLEESGRILTYAELIDAMYPDPEEQPDFSMETLRFNIWKARANGWAIQSWHHRGYVMI